MSSSKIERKLAAIMFTDIVGYTALSAKDSTKSSELLKTQRELLKPIVEKHGGSWMKEMGDGLLLTFDSATSAVECSIAIQKSTKEIDGLNLRIGIHEGEVIKQDGDVLGDDVNVAARIEPFSAEGGVAISQKVQQAISSNKEFETKFIGTPKLKGVAQEVKVYCITSHGLPETDISKVSAKLEQEPKFNIFALTGSVLATLGIIFWVAVGIFGLSFADGDELPSIAILPLDNRGNESDDFYAYGISSDLIAECSSAGNIRVGSLNDIKQIDYKNMSNKEIADKLDVTHIAQGTIWKRDSIFQLSMELYNRDEEKVLWSKRWENKWHDISLIKDKLSKNILKFLNIENDISNMIYNPKAYELYLRAKHIHLNRKTLSQKDTVIALLHKSIEIENNLLETKVLLADAYFEYTDEVNGRVEKNVLQAKDIYNLALVQAKEVVNKKIESEILTELGYIFLEEEKFQNAENNFKKSLEISEEIDYLPGIGRNNLHLAYVKNKIDRPDDEVFAHLDKSYAIFEKINDKLSMATVIADKASCEDDPIDAINLYKKSLSLSKSLGGNETLIARLEGVGHLYYSIDSLDQALSYYQEALDYAIIYDSRVWKNDLWVMLGLINIERYDFEQAKNHLLSYLHSKHSKAIGQKIDHYKFLGITYKNMGKYPKAIENFLTYFELVDSLDDEESIDFKDYILVKFITGLCYHYLNDYNVSQQYFENLLAMDIPQDYKTYIEIFYMLNNKYLNKKYTTNKVNQEIEEQIFTNCFKGNESYAPCNTCGYSKNHNSVQGENDCIDCTEGYEIDVVYPDCTGKCVLKGTAINSKQLSNCNKPTDFGYITELEEFDIDYELTLGLYELTQEIKYINMSYKQIQMVIEKVNPAIKAKFLSYPIPKAIVEEWEKVSKVKN